MAVNASALPGRLALTGLLSKRRLLGWAVVLVVGLGTLAPILLLIISSFDVAEPTQGAVFGLNNWKDAFLDSRILDAIWMTLKLAGTRVVIAVVAGIVFAWLIARTDMPGGSTFELLFWIAFWSLLKIQI